MASHEAKITFLYWSFNSVRRTLWFSLYHFIRRLHHDITQHSSSDATRQCDRGRFACRSRYTAWCNGVYHLYCRRAPRPLASPPRILIALHWLFLSMISYVAREMPGEEKDGMGWYTAAVDSLMISPLRRMLYHHHCANIIENSRHGYLILYSLSAYYIFLYSYVELFHYIYIVYASHSINSKGRH